MRGIRGGMRKRSEAAAQPTPAEPPPKSSSTPAEPPDDGNPGFHDDYNPPSLPPNYDKIVRTVFTMPEPHEVHARLRKGLQMSMRPSRADYGIIVDALDEAESNAQDAVDLLVNAELVLELFEIDARVIEASLRKRAVERMKAEREKGDKPHTEADVKAAIATLFPDEHRDLERRRAEAKGGIDSVRSLADRWREKVRDLRAMTQATRGV